MAFLCLPSGFKTGGLGAGRPQGRLGRRDKYTDLCAVLPTSRGPEAGCGQRRVSPYAPTHSFINEQLAEVARRLPRSQGALREVPGISEARVEKFGALLLEVTAK